MDPVANPYRPGAGRRPPDPEIPGGLIRAYPTVRDLGGCCNTDPATSRPVAGAFVTSR